MSALRGVIAWSRRQGAVIHFADLAGTATPGFAARVRAASSFYYLSPEDQAVVLSVEQAVRVAMTRDIYTVGVRYPGQPRDDAGQFASGGGGSTRPEWQRDADEGPDASPGVPADGVHRTQYRLPVTASPERLAVLSEFIDSDPKSVPLVAIGVKRVFPNAEMERVETVQHVPPTVAKEFFNGMAKMAARFPEAADAVDAVRFTTVVGSMALMLAGMTNRPIADAYYGDKVPRDGLTGEQVTGFGTLAAVRSDAGYGHMAVEYPDYEAADADAVMRRVSELVEAPDGQRMPYALARNWEEAAVHEFAHVLAHRALHDDPGFMSKWREAEFYWTDKPKSLYAVKSRERGGDEWFAEEVVMAMTRSRAEWTPTTPHVYDLLKLWQASDAQSGTATRHLLGQHDQQDHAGKGGTSEYAPRGYVDHATLMKARRHALAKFKDDPPPTPEEVAEMRALIAEKGSAAVERDLRGNSTSRRRSRERLLAEFGDGTSCACVYCGARLDATTIERDRIIPQSAGGRYIFENLVPADRGCNASRGDKRFTDVLGATRSSRIPVEGQRVRALELLGPDQGDFREAIKLEGPLEVRVVEALGYVRYSVWGIVADPRTIVEVVGPTTKRYSPDQPRDEDGRFGSGGGAVDRPEPAYKFGVKVALTAEAPDHPPTDMNAENTSRVSGLSSRDDMTHETFIAQQAAFAKALTRKELNASDWGSKGGADWLQQMVGDGKHALDKVDGQPTPEAQNAFQWLHYRTMGVWGATATDHDPVAVRLQRAAAETFGLNGDRLREHVGEFIWNEKQPPIEQFDVNTDSPDNPTADADRKVMGAMLRAQYDSTQAALAEAGITHVDIARGFRSDAVLRGKTSVATNPLSSWTSEAATAHEFADGRIDTSFGRGGGKHSYVAYTRVPAERILSTSATGIGDWSVNEWVVLGGSPLDVYVEPVRRNRTPGGGITLSDS